jgi:Domain of unknown function (DUF4926)
MPNKPPPEPQFREFERVSLLEPISSMGFDVPAGANGTIVDIHPDGFRFEVEFFEPHPCDATVEPNQIAKAP